MAGRYELRNPYLSAHFKTLTVIMISALIILHLYFIKAFPDADILPQYALFGTVLVFVGFLWIQEVRDRSRLQKLAGTLLKMQKQMEDAEIDTISVLILTEEAKDTYVRGHSRRVADIAAVIARGLGLSPEDEKAIERSGILHDIGKVGIVDGILKKSGALTPEEWMIMRGHPERALEILEPLKFLSREKGIIYHHHERYDGNGYPDGLKGTAIPLGSRILAVADTFDAMNSSRSYREQITREKIVAELQRVSGTQLDARVVSVFLDILGRDSALWEKNKDLSAVLC